MPQALLLGGSTGDPRNNLVSRWAVKDRRFKVSCSSSERRGRSPAGSQAGWAPPHTAPSEATQPLTATCYMPLNPNPLASEHRAARRLVLLRPLSQVRSRTPRGRPQTGPRADPGPLPASPSRDNSFVPGTSSSRTAICFDSNRNADGTESPGPALPLQMPFDVPKQPPLLPTDRQKQGNRIKQITV